MAVPCLLTAWQAHVGELRAYLHRHGAPADEVDDVLQEVFIKALRQDAKFCRIENARAWLFEVTRNALLDRLRRSREHVELPADIPAPGVEAAPVVDALSQCLPRVLAELSAADRLAITLCDLEGQTQQVLAERLGISLPGAKSRLQRARRRLRAQLVSACQVRFDADGEVCCFVPRPPLDKQGIL